MTIAQLIAQFLDGVNEGYTGPKSNPGNLKIRDGKLIHYSTVIAERCENGKFIVNLSRYSIQTGNVQKQLKAALEGVDYYVVKGVPIDYKGALIDFIKIS